VLIAEAKSSIYFTICVLDMDQIFKKTSVKRLLLKIFKNIKICIQDLEVRK